MVTQKDDVCNIKIEKEKVWDWTKERILNNNNNNNRIVRSKQTRLKKKSHLIEKLGSRKPGGIIRARFKKNNNSNKKT